MPPRTLCTSCDAASMASARPPASRSPILTSRLLPRPPYCSISTPIATASPTLWPACSHACSSSIPSCACTAIDENASGEVAPLLAYLRELQRRYGVAVPVVHHARKGAGNARVVQALRGSSEFHAWGDSNLYLRRDGDDLTLTVEHRAAPSLAPIAIGLAQRGPAQYCQAF